jgi:kinetochore protein Mis12/MTW1
MPPGTQQAPQPAPTTQNVPPLLLCEALGFSPQLLLDDIINIANNAVQDGVNGMEEFLNKWADERDAHAPAAAADAQGEEDATTHEVEQGLVAFQTLLEYHTDIAFDFFEAWCLRNIFMIPADLPVVLPHQEGLDLTATPEQEQDAMDEVEELRKRLDGVRGFAHHPIGAHV